MRRFGALCIVMGALLILCAGGWLTYNEADERRADEEAQKAVEMLETALERRSSNAETPVGEAIQLEFSTATAIKEVAVSAAEASTRFIEDASTVEIDDGAVMPVVIINGVAYIGYLSIPEIGLELPVQAECTEELLKNAPCWYAGSLKNRDLVIAGHNYKRHFTPVKQLKQGARVLFRDADNHESWYSVSRTETIDGTDVEGMLSGVDWDLTLFTCNYGGQKRIAVRLVIDEH